MKRNKRIRRIKGSLWRKCEWYSICGIHYNYNKDCGMCTTGKWVNVWRHFFEGILYKTVPSLWRWWANRPVRKKKWFNFIRDENYKSHN